MIQFYCHNWEIWFLFFFFSEIGLNCSFCDSQQKELNQTLMKIFASRETSSLNKQTEKIEIIFLLILILNHASVDGAFISMFHLFGEIQGGVKVLLMGGENTQLLQLSET